MAIGTSLGAYYESDLHHQAGLDNNVMDPELDPDRQTSDQNIKKPDLAPKSDGKTASTMPVGGPTEPTGAFNSEPGTSVPPENENINDYDYDSWKAANPGVEMAPGQHYPDTYKLPNHMTFSDESIYHGKDGNSGGHWGTDENGADTFTPGKTNLEQHSMSELRDYFKRVEPNAKLLPPDIDDVPHHDWVESLLSHAKEAFKLPGDVFGGKVDPTSQQGIEKAADLAGLMITGPAPVAAKMADGTLGSFMGVKSKTFNKDAYYKAEEQHLNGEHPDDIWDNTGTFQGADNKWRQEIPDKDAKLNMKAFDQTIEQGSPERVVDQNAPKGWGSVGGTEDKTTISLRKPTIPSLQEILNGTGDAKMKRLDLESVLDHPALYKAYPELRGVKVENFPYETSSYGMYSPGSNTIHLAKDLDPEFARGVLLHEIQHKIQDIEGFASGGRSSDFLSPEFQKQNKVFDDTFNDYANTLKDRGVPPENIERIKDTFKKDPEGMVQSLKDRLTPEDLKKPEFIKVQKLAAAQKAILDAKEEAFRKYESLAGEVEARNVQTRRSFDSLQRLRSPQSTADIPASQQILNDKYTRGYTSEPPSSSKAYTQIMSKKHDDIDVQRRQTIKDDLAKNPVEDFIKTPSPTKEIDRLIEKHNSGKSSITEDWILKRLLKDRYK